MKELSPARVSFGRRVRGPSSFALVLAFLAAPVGAVAQATLSAGESQVGNLGTNEVDEWIVNVGDQAVTLVLSSDRDLVLTTLSPSGQVRQVDSTYDGIEQVILDDNGTWSVGVSEFDGLPASYQIGALLGVQVVSSLPATGPDAPDALSPDQDPFGPDPFGPNQDPFASDPFGPDPLFQDLGQQQDGQPGVLDIALGLFADTLLPFVILLVLQAMTAGFVGRFMMRTSGPGESAAVTAEPEGARVSAAGALGVLDADSSSGIVLTGTSNERYTRALDGGRALLWGLAGSWIIFLILSVGVVYLIPDYALVLVVQAMIAVYLFVHAAVRYQINGNPFGFGYAILSAVLLTLPVLAIVPFTELPSGATAAGALPIALPILLFTVLARSGRQAASLGKQDLLILRVFGSDSSAVSTFRTIVRSWSFVGACVTIADPSYVRYEFSATDKGVRWRTLFMAVAIGVATVFLENPTGRSVLQSLPWLDGMTDDQLGRVTRAAVYLVLLPLAALPILIAVWRRFARDSEGLVSKIRTLMGERRRWNGFYKPQAFYCHDNLWRSAVQEMMEEAEIVLMDLRGFDSSNRGCEYEIGKVLDNVPIHRVVVLLDEATDREHVLGLFRDRWASLASESPNLETGGATLKVFSATPILTWRDGIWRWLWSLPRRELRWRNDANRILGFIAAAADRDGATPIPPAKDAKEALEAPAT